MKNTLEVFSRDRLIFSSRRRWLYPLFELEKFLKDNYCKPAKLTVRDTVVGRGAAFLLTRMGICSLRAGVLSLPAREILERAGIRYSWQNLVDKISCRTEEALSRVNDPEEAYRLLRQSL